MAKLATLIDDFEDGIISSPWFSSGSVTETGGRVTLFPTTSFSTLNTAVTYDATSSQIIVHVPTVTANGTTSTLQCGVVLQDSSGNQAAIRKDTSELQCVKSVGGVLSIVYAFPYSAANHLYWRMRESAGIFYWDASPNGTTWTNLFNTTVATNLFPVTNINVGFFAGWSVGFEAAPGTFQVESVNLPARITGSAVSISAGSLALRRVYSLTGSAASTSDGSLAITIPPLTSHALTGSGTSTTTGALSFIVLSVGQITAAGASTSNGSLSFRTSQYLTGTAQSFATGTLTLAITSVSVITQYFYFEPPVAYDNPPTLPGAGIINSHARWKGGQRRGRSVLRISGSYQTIDTPTVDQISSATEVYQGGHVYLITNIEADRLVTAGYIVTPIPINYTLYPALNVYPETTLYPAYQELIPV